MGYIRGMKRPETWPRCGEYAQEQYAQELNKYIDYLETKVNNYKAAFIRMHKEKLEAKGI